MSDRVFAQRNPALYLRSFADEAPVDLAALRQCSKDVLSALDAVAKERDEARDDYAMSQRALKASVERVAALEKALADSDRALLDCKTIAERATVNDPPWKEPNEIAYRVTTARNAISKALAGAPPPATPLPARDRHHEDDGA